MVQPKGKDRYVAVQQPTPPDHDEEMSDESEAEIVIDAELEKDETEEELERLVFGDSIGFKDSVKKLAQEDQGGIEDEDEAEDATTGLEGLDDAQLFFTDTGDDALQPPPTHLDQSEDETLRSKEPAAWEDSDDDRTMVSLASVPRLRKLRRTEAEDIISGKEYCRRLRKQFELLNPAPQWAQTALQRPARKKRRTSEAARSDEDVSDVEMEIDSDLPSVAPLSDLLQDAESLVRQAGTGAGKKRKLRPEVIDIQRQKDIAGVQPGAITSLSFHPNLPLLLSSGPSSTLYLHHLSQSPPASTPNPLLTSLHIHGSQLTTTAFHPTDSRIFLSARRRYFHIWNLTTGQVEKITRIYGQQHEQRSMEHFKLSPDGRFMALQGSTKKGGGVVNVLDASTLQWISQVRIESRGGIADFAWWRDGRGLCVAGKNGEISEWSVEQQRVVCRWQDEGAVGTTTLTLGGEHEVTKGVVGTDRWIAVGSSSGIVNIYDRRVWLGSNPKAAKASSISASPKPTRMLDHLTTPTSHLAFSPDGQILAIASKWKRDAIRLVHLPSCTVYRNWPTSSTPLGRITGVALAAGDIVQGSDAHSVLAVANEQGKIRLWEIR